MKTTKDKTKQGRKAAGRAKGTGSLEKHGKTWRAVWKVRGADGKQKVFTRSTGTSDKREAEKKLAEFVAPYRLKMEAGKDAAAAKLAERSGMDAATASVLAGAAKAKRAEAGRLSVPLSKGWEVFMASLSRNPISPATARMYGSRWEAFAKWMKKNRPHVVGLADVDDDTASAFMRSIRERWSAKTFNDYRALLLMVWKTLDKEAGLDGFNPWKGIKTLDRETHNRRELTAEELARVVGPLKGEMRVLFAIGIYTGLRLGDAVNLDWGAVDLVRGFLQWTPHKTKKHGTLVRIPLFPALAAILAETPARRRRGLILPGLAEEYGRYSSYTSERVAKVFRDAGITTQGDTGRVNPKNKKTTRKAIEVGFHSLRHTFVSLCANAGVPLSIVQAIVGHTNVAMTTHYFHVSDSALQGAVAVLPDVFRPVAALPAHNADDAAAEVVEDADVEVVEAVPLAAGGRGGTTAASGALDASPAILDGMRAIVDALAGMTADNWKTQRDRALAIAARVQQDSTTD